MPDTRGRRRLTRAPSYIESIDWTHPLSRGLIGWWPLWGQYITPSLVRDVARGKHGTISGANTRTVLAGDAHYGNVYDLGLSALIPCGAHTLHEVQSHTVCMTIKPDTVSGTLRMIFGKCNNVLSGGFEWSYSTNGIGLAYHSSGGVEGWFYVTHTLTALETVRLCCVYDADAAQAEAYVNGVSVGTVTTDTDSDKRYIEYSNDTLDIGHGHSNTTLTGIPVDCRFYNRVFTAAEAQQDCNLETRFGLIDAGYDSTYAPDGAAGEVNVNPNAGSLALVGASPSVALKINKSLAAGALTLTGESPGVAVEAPGETAVNPNPGSIALAGASPSVALKLNYTLVAGVVTLTGESPSVETVAPSVDFALNSGSLALAGNSPSIALRINVSPTPAALALTGETLVIDYPGFGEQQEFSGGWLMRKPRTEEEERERVRRERVERGIIEEPKREVLTLRKAEHPASEDEVTAQEQRLVAALEADTGARLMRLKKAAAVLLLS